MNLIFGQRERKEIGARTKRAMEQMVLERVHPAKAPYGYVRNIETGHLEIEPIEANVVREIFELCKKGHSSRGIATIMKENNTYLKTGKWRSDKVYKILTNAIYIGTFAFGKYKRKSQDILYVENYCEPIIDECTWNITRKTLEKNKHSNYGEHIHLFTSIVKCPDCGKVLSSTNSFKNSGTVKEKVYYHLTCKNPNCKSKGVHYNSDKIENKLMKILNELTRYMYDNTNEILVSSSKKSNELNIIEKAIDKLKVQEKRLVDLYLSSNLPVETINLKNQNIKKELEKLSNKKKNLSPEDESKEYTVELLKKLDYTKEDNNFVFSKDTAFSFLWNSLNRKSKKEMITKIISSIEITRDKNYNIEIKSLKFTEEFISKNTKEYLEYLQEILTNNITGISYKKTINESEIDKLSEKYIIISIDKLENNSYPKETLDMYTDLIKDKFYNSGIICCPYIEKGIITDNLLLVEKPERLKI